MKESIWKIFNLLIALGVLVSQEFIQKKESRVSIWFESHPAETLPERPIHFVSLNRSFERVNPFTEGVERGPKLFDSGMSELIIFETGWLM